MNVKDILKLIASIFVCQLAGMIGAVATSASIQTWYVTLNKPFFHAAQLALRARLADVVHTNGHLALPRLAAGRSGSSRANRTCTLRCSVTPQCLLVDRVLRTQITACRAPCYFDALDCDRSDYREVLTALETCGNTPHTLYPLGDHCRSVEPRHCALKLRRREI